MYSFFIRLKRTINIYLFVQQNNIINKEILKQDINELNKDNWPILEKYQLDDLYLIIKGHKEYYTIIQYIDNFKNIEIFCIEYSKIEGYIN